MTIRGFYEAARPYATFHPVQALEGWRLALDADFHFMQAMAGAGYKRPPVRAFLYRVLSLLESGLLPVAVFDGPQRQPLKERRGPDFGQGDAHRVTWLDTYPELSRALELLGVPCLVAAGEADPALALLSRGGEVDGVALHDVDSLACLWRARGAARRELQGRRGEHRREALAPGPGRRGARPP